MKSLYSFIVKPYDDRYDNIRRVDGNNLIINTSIENHRFISKKAVVVSTPAAYTTKINIGDELYIHHNVFRRWYNQKGEEQNTSQSDNVNNGQGEEMATVSPAEESDDGEDSDGEDSDYSVKKEQITLLGKNNNIQFFLNFLLRVTKKKIGILFIFLIHLEKVIFDSSEIFILLSFSP